MAEKTKTKRTKYLDLELDNLNSKDERRKKMQKRYEQQRCEGGRVRHLSGKIIIAAIRGCKGRSLWLQ